MAIECCACPSRWKDVPTRRYATTTIAFAAFLLPSVEAPAQEAGAVEAFGGYSVQMLDLEGDKTNDREFSHGLQLGMTYFFTESLGITGEWRWHKGDLTLLGLEPIIEADMRFSTFLVGAAGRFGGDTLKFGLHGLVGWAVARFKSVTLSERTEDFEFVTDRSSLSGVGGFWIALPRNDYTIRVAQVDLVVTRFSDRIQLHPRFSVGASVIF